jgi:hypothetical protein
MQPVDAHEYGNGTCLFTRDGEAACVSGRSVAHCIMRHWSA